MSKRSASASSHRRSILSLIIGALVVGIVALIVAVVQSSDGSTDGPTGTVASDPQAPGRLVAQAATIDLGRVPFEQRTEARFILANTGGNTVQLVGAPRVRMLEGC